MEENESVGTPAAQESAEDPIKNLKAEMNRKLENTNAQLQQLIAALNKPTPVPGSDSPKKVSVFDDEEAYATRIKNETAAEIKREMAYHNAQQQKQAAVIQSLTNEFPELMDGGHELTKRAIELYNSFPEDERASPIAYKAAVKEAALELDIKPAAKRKSVKNDDDFVMSSGGANISKAEASKMDKAREELAAKFGLTLTPESKERLKQHAKRDFRKFS